eukprot:6451492-Prymnesium_polylepis.2
MYAEPTSTSQTGHHPEASPVPPAKSSAQGARPLSTQNIVRMLAGHKVRDFACESRTPSSQAIGFVSRPSARLP